VVYRSVRGLKLNVVYFGVQVVLAGGALLIAAGLLLLVLKLAARIVSPFSGLQAQLCFAVWPSMIGRPWAGLLASTPSRAPPSWRFGQSNLTDRDPIPLV
jgi:hypothetical protein